MSALFLSASIPLPNRGNYHETADPFLIQMAIRELVIATIREHKLVWGGHPSITPMIWAICEDLGLKYTERVVLYQSKFFKTQFPDENRNFRNVVETDAAQNKQDSLLLMRKQMLSRPDLAGAVFIAGMEGIEEEFDLFHALQPRAYRLVVSAPGGAALQLAQRLGESDDPLRAGVDFASLYQSTIVPALGSRPADRPKPHPSLGGDSEG